MSRDWTPQEFRQADKQLGFRAANIKLIMSNGEEIPFSPNKEDLEKYPNFAFYGESVFLAVKNSLDKILISEVEECLNTIIQREDIGIDPVSWENSPNLLYVYVSKWYRGVLKPGYYMEDNNYAFEEFLKAYPKRRDYQ